MRLREQLDPQTLVDVWWPLRGGPPQDCSPFGLYAALLSCLDLGHPDWLAVHPRRRERLGLRVPRTEVSRLSAALSGQQLVVGESALLLGREPEIRPLRPAATLWARCTVKQAERPTRLSAARAFGEQLEMLGIYGARLDVRPAGRVGASPWGEQSWHEPAWHVQVQALSPPDSLLLQAQGLGGRRTMGCGLFVPCPGEGGAARRPRPRMGAAAARSPGPPSDHVRGLVRSLRRAVAEGDQGAAAALEHVLVGLVDKAPAARPGDSRKGGGWRWT